MMRKVAVAAVVAWATASPVFLGITEGLSDESSARELQGLIATLRITNPGFSEENCANMYQTKVKLGSAVPPGDVVVGCDKVCESARAIKEYWKSGDMATYACETVGKFGCAYDGTPPLTAAGIGC